MVYRFGTEGGVLCESMSDQNGNTSGRAVTQDSAVALYIIAGIFDLISLIIDVAGILLAVLGIGVALIGINVLFGILGQMFLGLLFSWSGVNVFSPKITAAYLGWGSAKALPLIGGFVPAHTITVWRVIRASRQPDQGILKTAAAVTGVKTGEGPAAAGPAGGPAASRARTDEKGGNAQGASGETAAGNRPRSRVNESANYANKPPLQRASQAQSGNRTVDGIRPSQRNDSAPADNTPVSVDEAAEVA